MGVSQLSGGQSGLLLPYRNGFANRMIFRNPGAVNFVFPDWVVNAKVAILGGGGGGCLQIIGSSPSNNTRVGQGGAGGGYSQKLFRGVGGLTLTGTVAAPGLGGNNSTYTSEANNLFMPGGNGGTTTLSLNGLTMSATGGAGAPVPQASPVAALGGVGSGGDVNTSGGSGGRDQSNYGLAGGFSVVFMAGGGASGSPRGNGGNGGNGGIYSSGTSQYNAHGAGGGWGGDGAGFFATTGNPLPVACGGGSLGPGKVAVVNTQASVLGGKGGTPIYIDSNVPSATQGVSIAQEPQWWDLDDVNGWGGGYNGKYINNRGLILNPQDFTSWGQDGQDGGGGSSNGLSGASAAYGGNGGFGGGGAGTMLGTTLQTNNSFLGNPIPIPLVWGSGGVGGGGGAAWFTAGSGLTAGANRGQIRAGDGGSGCIIVWF